MADVDAGAEAYGQGAKVGQAEEGFCRTCGGAEQAYSVGWC